MIEPIVERMISFLDRIGLSVRTSEISEPSFLPGIAIRGGALVVDESRLLYPGDLLHEAGHLALLPPEARAEIFADAGVDAGFEMGAIAWSYAAALHLGIDPAVVFHESGYKGASTSILENFAAARYIGVPILQWVGLTTTEAYPSMHRWLRD
jgi:hypothetical protein